MSVQVYHLCPVYTSHTLRIYKTRWWRDRLMKAATRRIYQLINRSLITFAGPQWDHDLHSIDISVAEWVWHTLVWWAKAISLVLGGMISDGWSSTFVFYSIQSKSRSKNKSTPWFTPVVLIACLLSSSHPTSFRTGQVNHVPSKDTGANLNRHDDWSGARDVRLAWMTGMPANQKRNKIRIRASRLLSSPLPPCICSRLEKVICRDGRGREQTIVTDGWMTKTKLQGSACMCAYSVGVHTYRSAGGSAYFFFL